MAALLALYAFAVNFSIFGSLDRWRGPSSLYDVLSGRICSLPILDRVLRIIHIVDRHVKGSLVYLRVFFGLTILATILCLLPSALGSLVRSVTHSLGLTFPSTTKKSFGRLDTRG